MMRDRRVLLVVGGICLVIIVLIFLFSNRASDTQDTSFVLTDRDTGDSIDLSPEQQQFTGAPADNVSPVILFGVAELSVAIREQGNGTTGEYFDQINKAIWKYSSERFKDSYETMTVRPQATKINGRVISTELRLGQGGRYRPDGDQDQ